MFFKNETLFYKSSTINIGDSFGMLKIEITSFSRAFLLVELGKMAVADWLNPLYD